VKPRRRVAITGVGLVTPLGRGLPAVAAAFGRGESAAAPATLFDASGFASALAAEVRDFDPRPSFRAPKALKLCDRRTQLAVAAASDAVADARLDGTLAPEELGVILGTSGSDLGAPELSRAVDGAGGAAAKDVPLFARKVLSGLSPLWLLVHLPNMTGAHVAIQAGARGPNDTVMTGWAAGLQAVGEGAAAVARGDAEAVLAGGTDSAIHPFAFAGFQQAGWLGGDGFVPGEGAVVLVLEEWERARRRGARVRGEVVGWSSGVVDGDADLERLARRAGAGEAGSAPRRFAGKGSAAAAGRLFAAHGPFDLALGLAAADTPCCVAAARGPWGESAVVSVRTAPSLPEGAA